MKTLLPIVLLFLTACTGNVDEPTFSIISQEGQVQVREYAGTSIAYTMVEGERDDAIGDGFRKLFKYIQGENVSAESIPMTAPVAQSAGSQKIPMTAPVAQSSVGDDEWKVVFYMPNETAFADLPKPTDEAVKLEVLPKHQKIVLQFSGSFDTENIAESEARLRRYMSRKGVKFSEPPVYAGYNPPWTPAFMRRNEVMFRLK